MKIIVYINFTLTLFLIGGFVWLLFFNKPQVLLKEENVAISSDAPIVDNCGDECKKEIAKQLAMAQTVDKSGEDKKVIFITPVPQVSKTQINYIPISGPLSTTSSNWYDAPGTDLNLNLKGDYGDKAVATWEGSLKIAHSNGTAYARIYDVTHGIAVNGSEISVTNKADFTQSYSGNLSFWAGNNQYRIQLKSLNTFEATFGSGKIKIVY